ncbi:hypothetical protein IWX90DRAFT_13433 [Phyllosticta citrichinensis]|uniref:Uncharacterized protein n=1 Tax=Phyllosticta citrichinensis TaxID=1130410 RepID=A0ABR1Y5U8_9PEZI
MQGAFGCRLQRNATQHAAVSPISSSRLISPALGRCRTTTTGQSRRRMRCRAPRLNKKATFPPRRLAGSIAALWTTCRYRRPQNMNGRIGGFLTQVDLVALEDDTSQKSRQRPWRSMEASRERYGTCGQSGSVRGSAHLVHPGRDFPKSLHAACCATQRCGIFASF